MADKASRRYVRGHPPGVCRRGAVLHSSFSRREWFSPRRLKRRSLVVAERKHPSVFFLEIALRTSASSAAGTFGEGKRRRAAASLARGECAAQCVLRPGAHARAEASFEA